MGWFEKGPVGWDTVEQNRRGMGRVDIQAGFGWVDIQVGFGWGDTLVGFGLVDILAAFYRDTQTYLLNHSQIHPKNQMILIIHAFKYLVLNNFTTV